MAKKEFTGLWVPIDILQNEELTSTEKLVLAVIYGLAKDGLCTASNDYIADTVGTGTRNLQKVLSRLINCGYIKIKLFRDEKKIIRRIIHLAYQSS